jgi:hypothetical protein
MNNSLINWIGLFINIVLVLGFIILISVMFYKNLDYIYIICTILLTLLPISGVLGYLKKIKK